MTSKNINTINLIKYYNDSDNQDQENFDYKQSPILSKKIAKQAKSPSGDKKEKTKKNLWTQAEDKLLIELIAQYGQKWTLIGRLIGGRKCKQVRDRYLNYLNPEIKTTPFTPEEDNQLISLFNKMGNKWKQIANNMTGRSESQVKNRYYRHLKGILTASSTESSPFEINKYSSISSNSTEDTENNDHLDFTILNQDVHDIYFPSFTEQEKPSYSCLQTEFFRTENFFEEYNENHLSDQMFYQSAGIKDLSTFETQFISAQNLIFDDDEIHLL